MSTLHFPFRETTFQFLGDISDSLKTEIVHHPLFIKWLNSLDQTIILQTVKLQSIIRNENNKIIYLKIDTKSIRNGGIIPRIIILQGYSFSTLIVLISKQTRKHYTILIRKILISTGRFQNIIPFQTAGIQDPDENIAANFIKSVIGIEVDVSDVFNIAAKATNNQIQYVYSYCGPSDQIMKYFCTEKEVSEDFIWSLDEKQIKPNEFLKIIPIDEVETSIQDFVSLAPFMYYQSLNSHS